MELELTLRLAQPQDDYALGELLIRSFTETYAQRMPEVVVHEERRTDLRDVASKRATAQVWVAERKGEILGTVTLFPPGHPQSKTWLKSACDLRYMAVLPEFHGKGIAESLVQVCLSSARAMESQSVTLHVRKGAQGVAAFYHRLGFVRAREGDLDLRPEIYLEAREYSLTNPFPAPKPGRPSLVLAPMEGLTDAPMRAVLTKSRSFSYAVAEFLRVSQEPLGVRVIRRHVLESQNAWRTAAHVPVQLQLLGGDPERLATTAEHSVQCGVQAIDLNFGCPAPTVNRNDGGATLLKYPERIRSIVSAVRARVPKSAFVSAKLRLGWDNHSDIDRNAEEAFEGGADWIVIHGRSKLDGYRPPADWKAIGRVRARFHKPVVANGDLWTLEDWKRCRDETGSEHFMLGRGAVADPALVTQIANEVQLDCFSVQESPRTRGDWAPWVRDWISTCRDQKLTDRQIVSRLKQWMRIASGRHRFDGFDELKHLETLEEFFDTFKLSP